MDEENEKLTSIKVFLPPDEKNKYHKICFDKNIKMSADIRDYIVSVVSGESKQDIINEILSLMSATERPSNSKIVKLARKLDVQTEVVMQWCDRLFPTKQECRHG